MHAHYTWNDEQYRDFMESLLKRLEPRKEAKNTILLNENDEVNEVLFFVKGVFVVGFELNKRSYYLIKF